RTRQSMGSAALAEAAKSIRDWSLNDRTSTTPAVRAADVFGSLVVHANVPRHAPPPAGAAAWFGSLWSNDKLQQERLPKPAYRALRATITRGEPLDGSTADAVATALKDCGVEAGGRPH